MSKPKHQTIAENLFYVIGGMYLVCSIIDGISSTIDFITLTIAIWGTVILIFVAIILRMITPFKWKNKEGKINNVVKLNKRPFLFLIAVLLVLWLPILIKLTRQNEELNLSNEEIIFRPIFKQSDSSSFNILILRFEDYIADKNTYCIGRALKENLNILNLEYDETQIKSFYVADTIKPPIDPEEVQEIQKRHNADLLIYGLARNLEEDCGSADVCFRYLIKSSLSNSVNEKLDIEQFKNDLEFIKTTPFEIENGQIAVNHLIFKRWITALTKLKFGKREEALLELDKIGNDITLPLDVRSKRFSDIAITYWQLREYKEAMNSISKSISIDSLNWFPYLVRGEFKYNLGEYISSHSDFEKSINLNPNYALSYVKRHRVLKEIYEFDEAVEDLEEAIRLGYDKEKVFIQMIALFVQIDNEEKATQTMKRALVEVNNSQNLQNLSLILPIILKNKSQVIYQYEEGEE